MLCFPLPLPAYFLYKAHHNLLGLNNKQYKALLHYTWGPFKTAKSPRKSKKCRKCNAKETTERMLVFTVRAKTQRQKESFDSAEKSAGKAPGN